MNNDPLVFQIKIMARIQAAL
ncbi:MAG: Transcriptional regulator [Lactobacillus helveticus]|uniref:Uncharacterized protein n=1 Tax=Lactobacillus helveticus CIRM-BIA 104 TaxID=1226333 RepID=U6FFP6_LACHE|nr:Protein of unknown function [Lactobacillus helveticus CIRM-BIA 104]